MTQRIEYFLRYEHEDNFVANATYEDSLNLIYLIPYNTLLMRARTSESVNFVTLVVLLVLLALSMAATA